MPAPEGYALQISIPSLNQSSAHPVQSELDSVRHLDDVLKAFEIPVGTSVELSLTEQRAIDDPAEEISISSSFPAYVGDVLSAHTSMWAQMTGNNP
jgi:hypothetical protein